MIDFHDPSELKWRQIPSRIRNFRFCDPILELKISESIKTLNYNYLWSQ